MHILSLFKNIDESSIEELLNSLNGRKISFRKDMTILSNLNNTNEIGIVLDGEASLIRVDYNGNRTIVSLFEKDDLFGGFFKDYMNEEMYVKANTDTEILFLEYDRLLENKGILANYHDILTKNMIDILVKKVSSQNKRIDILNKRTTRDKLLEYFHILESEHGSMTISIPINYTLLAEYLAVDRAAMMRELKILKDEGIIERNNRKITLIYR